MDEVLGQEGGLAVCAVVVEERPGVVIPHGGGTGLAWKQKTLRVSEAELRAPELGATPDCDAVYNSCARVSWSRKRADWTLGRGG